MNKVVDLSSLNIKCIIMNDVRDSHKLYKLKYQKNTHWNSIL